MYIVSSLNPVYKLFYIFKENIQEEETLDQYFKPDAAHSATVSSTKQTPKQRAASQPRQEGIDSVQEVTGDIDKYKADESIGQKTLHKEMHDKALKVSRPVGVRLN